MHTAKKNLFTYFLFLLLLFLPTQLGKHFFFDFSYIRGVPVDYLSLVLYTTDILALLVILLNLPVIFAVFRHRTKEITVFALLFLLNGVYSLHWQVYLYHLVKYFELFCLFLVFQRGKVEKKIIIVALTIGAAIELFITISQLYLKHSLQGVMYFLGERSLTLSMADIAKASIRGVEFLRPYGTFSHPNSMAGFYVLVYFFALFYENKKGHNIDWLRIVLLFCSGALVLISFSKLAVITFLIGNLLVLIKKGLQQCTICTISRTLILIVMVMVVFAVQTDPLTLQKRWLLLQHGITILGSHIVQGVGLGNYLYYESGFPMPYSFFFLQPVHNIFLLFFAETGLLLGISMMWHLYKMFKPYAAREEIRILLLVIIITGFFDHYWITLQQNWLLMAVIFGVLLQKSTRPRDAEL